MKDRPGPKEVILLAMVAIGIAVMFILSPMAQDLSYHRFADQREFYDVPNFWNVMSNLPLLVLGLFGMLSCFRIRYNRSMFDVSQNACCFFAGIFLTGIGSAYYHWNPNNQTMMWDRLPMCIAFMAFFCMVVQEFISIEAGRKLLLPLLALGVMSAIYWQFTESRGQGDLRFYALVQFLPMILIPTILILYRKNSSQGIYFWVILLSYVVAKVLEKGDQVIYDFTPGVSGHALKHLAVALVPGILLFRRRA